MIRSTPLILEADASSVVDCSNLDPPILWPQSDVCHRATGWHRAAFEEVEARVADEPNFPCVFSKNAFRKQLLKFIFVEDTSPAGLWYLAKGLKHFVEISENWDGNLNTAYPLVVAFSKQAITAQTVEEYHAFGWNILQRLSEIDPVPWPEHVSRDPHSPSWSMCFNGMPIFCNMSNPVHKLRKSRNLGAHFKFIINPRERFDVVAGDTPAGRKARANIRDRIHQYDGQPHCPQLGSYGSGGIEWWQYGIIEENAERSDKCPFHADIERQPLRKST